MSANHIIFKSNYYVMGMLYNAYLQISVCEKFDSFECPCKRPIIATRFILNGEHPTVNIYKKKGVISPNISSILIYLRELEHEQRDRRRRE